MPLPAPMVPTPTPIAPSPTPIVPMAHLPFFAFHDTPSNWDAFSIGIWSGLLYSAVVTLTISIAIYVAQRTSDNKRFRNECKWGIAAFVSRMRSVFLRPQNEIADVVPFTLYRIIDVIQDHGRIAIWRSVVPEQRPLYDAVDMYEAAYEAYARISLHLSGIIGHLVVEYYDNYQNSQVSDV